MRKSIEYFQVGGELSCERRLDAVVSKLYPVQRYERMERSRESRWKKERSKRLSHFSKCIGGPSQFMCVGAV
jgi:hypothetical protein